MSTGEAVTSAHVIEYGTDALRVVSELVPSIAAGAAERDRDHAFPLREVGLLAQSGLLAVTVPRAYGGAEVSAATLTEIVRRLAEADPSVAQIPQSHFVFLDLLRRVGDPDQQERYFGAVLAGVRLANAQTERGTATVADNRTTLRWDGSGYRLTGEKFYCTGSVGADILTVRARIDGGPLAVETAIAFVPTDRNGVEVCDDWDAVGQRTTGSGTVRLTEVSVPPEDVLPFASLFDAPSTYGARAQILHAAIDAGIARGALRAGIAAAGAARPWFEADVARAVDDPLTINQAGECELQVRGAEALLRTAADTIDAADANLSEAAAAEASLAVAAAKVASARAAVAVAEAIFDLGGTRVAVSRDNLSRFWRDARTHTLHDPARWKLQHLGRWALSGTLPPRHGQI